MNQGHRKRAGGFTRTHSCSHGTRSSASTAACLTALFVAYDVKAGIYGVRLFLNGTWTFVVVDDYVGFNRYGRLCFASSQDN